MSPLAAKHISQDPESLVKSALQSLKFLNPALVVDIDQKIVYHCLDKSASNSRQQDVAIISGGGSGHEPSFGGLVGPGLLTAAVSGTIFASPNAQQILLAIDRVSTFSNEILVTLMNYTGDILNFGMAVEKAQATWPELRIEMLVVADDVAVPRSSYGNVGRRGMAGTVLVHKMTGALAGLGYKMKDILRAGRLICDNLVTIGVALDRVQVPGTSFEISSSHHLCSDEVEIGMGIHNEPGCARVSGLDAELGALVKSSLAQLLGTQDLERSFVKEWLGCAVLLVNNLGGLSALELGAALAETVDQLHNNYNIQPKRIISGTYMTSLDCRGFSITLLNDISLELPRDVEELLDYPAGAVGWNPNISLGRQTQAPANYPRAKAVEKSNGKSDVSQQPALRCDTENICSSLHRGLEAVISAEPEITQYDTITGDGDCGTTLKRGATRILQKLSRQQPTNIIELLSLVGAGIQDEMDGTSGAIYSIFIDSLQQYFISRASEPTTVDLSFWVGAVESALSTLLKYTSARTGDRTLMDVLIPFVETLVAKQNSDEAVHAARSGALSTKHMVAGMGRAVYVGNQAEWLGKIPDAGAWGLYKLIQGLLQ